MKDFVQSIPFFRLLVALVAGIVLFEFFPSLNEKIFLSLLVAGIICMATYPFLKHKTNLSYQLRWLFGGGVVLFFLSLGFLVSWHTNRKNHFEHLGEEGLFVAKIIAPPREKTKTYTVKLHTEAFAPDSVHFVKTQGNALLHFKKEGAEDIENWRIGDRIVIANRLVPFTPNGNPSAFDYARYMHRKGFRATAYSDTVYVCDLLAEQFSVLQLADDCRKQLMKTFTKYGIEGEEFSVLAALTLGYQEEISDDLYEAYSNSGAMHILSVSGLHVGIIYAVFTFLFSFLEKLPRGKILKSLIIITLLMTYAFITGLSPSVLRASIMFSLVAFGNSFLYKSKIYNTIFFSALILLLINPNYLFDIGFQLSYVAVLGIVFFQPMFKNLLVVHNKPLRWCWELFCVSIAAQIATFPLGMFYFSKFSNYFLLTNYLAIPISTLIIYAGVLLFVVPGIPLIATWVAWCLNWLLKALNGSVVFVDKLPFSTAHTWYSELDTILVYLIIAGISIFILQKRFAALTFALCCLLIFQGTRIYSIVHSHQQTEMIVYSDWKTTAVNFIHKGGHSLYTTDFKRTKVLASPFWMQRRLPEPTLLGNTATQEFVDNFYVFEGKKIALITDTTWRNKLSDNRIELDYLILGNKSSLRFRDIESMFEPKLVIVDETYPVWETERLKKACLEKDIAFYSTRENGAFRVNFSNEKEECK
jgi:competence protein ComEC